MSTSIRSSALAIGATVLALSAYAGPTTVDFESLLSGLPTTMNTQDVGSRIGGFTFTGANAYGPAQIANPSFSIPKDGAPGQVFVMSRAKVDSAASTYSNTISVSLTGENAKEDIASLTFDSWIFSNELQVWAYVNGVAETVGSALTGGGDSIGWGTRTIDLSAYTGKVDRIDFTASAPNTLFALDNLTFSFSTSGGGGGTVPEPAGFGLVALALAGAGIASKRRSR